MCEIRDKKQFKRKYEKLRKYLFKMKESNKVVLGKWLFASLKGKICLTKGHLCNQEGHMKTEYFFIGSCF